MVGRKWELSQHPSDGREMEAWAGWEGGRT